MQANLEYRWNRNVISKAILYPVVFGRSRTGALSIINLLLAKTFTIHQYHIQRQIQAEPGDHVPLDFEFVTYTPSNQWCILFNPSRDTIVLVFH